MLNSITSPLDGIRSPFGAIRNPFAAYAIGGRTPQTIADFEADKYRADGTTSTAASLLTHTRSGNAVQVADDGTLQWAGHNLLTYSEDFSNALWSTAGTPITKTTGKTDPRGTNTAVELETTGTFGTILQDKIMTPSFLATNAVWVKGVNVTGAVNLYSPSGSTTDISGSLTSEWQLFSVDGLYAGGGSIRWRILIAASGDIIQVAFPHLYRSDLGGMADIPTSYRGLSSSSTYLPTTTAARYLPRVDNHIWDGSSWVKRCLVEPQSTNLLLNSDTLATQNATVTAALHTLHFTGTGTVTLSGASTAGPLVGTGTGEQNRVSLQFTPTAGTLTLTVTGTVSNAQLETGVQTSYIPTAGATVTRPADALSIDSTLLPYDSTAMTLAMDGEMTYADTDSLNEVQFAYWKDDNLNLIYIRLRGDLGTGGLQFGQADAGTFDSVTQTSSYSPGVNVPFNIASRHTSSDINGAVDGTALTADTTPTALPDLSATDFEIAPTGVVNIKSLRILGGYGATDAELEAATT